MGLVGRKVLRSQNRHHIPLYRQHLHCEDFEDRNNAFVLSDYILPHNETYCQDLSAERRLPRRLHGLGVVTR
jgi:hypothetical protein